jgi:hypothetical protein
MPKLQEGLYKILQKICTVLLICANNAENNKAPVVQAFQPAKTGALDVSIYCLYPLSSFSIVVSKSTEPL